MALSALARPAVKDIVSGCVLGVDNVLITNPQQTSFGIQFDASITNVGPVDATISFENGLTVSWNGQRLGNLPMDDVDVVGGVGATFNVQTTFKVADVNVLTSFIKVLLNEESFQWEISGENLTVTALGIGVPGISLPTKVVTLKGFNGLKDGVTIDSFDLPANDPSGGIHVTIQSTVTNPSQVGIELSSIAFNTYTDGIEIAPISSSSSFIFAPQSTLSLPLAGRLIPQSTPKGLAAVSTIFNNFVHGMNTEVTGRAVSAGPTDVTWLNEAIQSLHIKTSLPNRGKLDVLQSIALEQLKLLFTQATAYDPMSSSNATIAAFTLPFAFPIDITSLSPKITVGFPGHEASFAELDIREAPSTTDVQTRIIHLTFSDVPFAVFANKNSAFNNFVAITTSASSQTLVLSGTANAAASTAVGVLSLTDIAFSVNFTIAGLQGLLAKPPTVSNLDVNHGYSDCLLVTLDTTLYNPSNLTIGAGDVSFHLQFDGETIGSVDLSNIVIQPGAANYSANVRYSPQGSSKIVAGRTMLENCLQGIDSNVVVLGTPSSTPIESLQPALSQIKLPVTVPALHHNLINTATLEFPTNIVQTGVASASFTLTNPFTASISLLKVTATATFQNLTVGKIDNVDVSSNPIHASGHSNITSPVLPFDFNLDPLMIIQLITISAQEHNVDLGPLTQLFQLILNNPNFHPPVKTSVATSARTYASGNQFDFDDAILNAMRGLQVDLVIDSSLTLDDYGTSLSFSQKGVTAITDKTALYLVGVVAAPTAQYLMDGAVLAFSEANITNISNNGFNLALRGSLTNVGPLDALIEFVEPLTVNWRGHGIATISLPPVCVAANTGVPNYATQGTLVITDQTQFTSFATYLLHNPSFEWTISTSRLRVTALGTIFDNVSLKKTVAFSEASSTFKAILSTLDPSSYPAPSNLRCHYVDAASAIREVIEETIKDMPRILIDTVTGDLYDRTRQAAAFEELPIYNELRSSMTTQVDYARIREEVEEFYRYVMLSHRWQPHEPRFQTVENISIYKLPASPAFSKLKNFCILVRTLGFKWAWSDTCCVNQLDKAVQQESLVAMFRWYRGSSLTVVHLLGVSSKSRMIDALRRSIWNTRGWTYQEYLASEVVQFYTEDWKPYLGLQMFNHKESPDILLEMERAMHFKTEELVSLQPGVDKAREKLFLASKRQTTREEDRAYSLFGIFKVALPVIYGEGNQAIGRLLEHILTYSDNVTLLAWTGSSGSHSYLPSDLSVYDRIVPPHIPTPIETANMEGLVKTLRRSLPNLSQAIKMYEQCYRLRSLLISGRLQLSGILFPLADLVRLRGKSGLATYRTTSPMLGVIDIQTRDELSGLNGFLIHPWISPLVDLDFSRDKPLFDEATRALRLIVRLKQPFGALLLTPVSRSQYRRVATDSLIMVRVREETSLSDLKDGISTLDIQ